MSLPGLLRSSPGQLRRSDGWGVGDTVDVSNFGQIRSTEDWFAIVMDERKVQGVPPVTFTVKALF
jgi:hypothetical protein